MAIDFAIEDRRVREGVHVVAVTGEIDLFTAPEFKARIHDAIEDGRDLVVVDLTATTFIDSSSLGVLISAHRRLKGRGGRLVVVSDVPAVMSTFKITGLDSVLEMAGSRDEALSRSEAPGAARGAA
jgi:anti-sigma B factor antagonist